MKTYSLTMVKSYAAVGGKAAEDITDTENEEDYGPTDAGLYTILKIEPHKSGGAWPNAVVPWEAETKIDKNNVVEVSIRGKWVRLSSLKGWNGPEKNLWKDEKKTYQALLLAYDNLFDKHTPSATGKLMNALEVNRKQLFKIMGIGYIRTSLPNREVPDKWILNEFGHKAIKFFEDNNHNGNYDKGDTLSGEFIHSSPDTEFWNDLGLLSRAKIKEKALKRGPFSEINSEFELWNDKKILGFSHGCIHAFPSDIDEMIEKGYVKKKAIVQVHKYGDKSRSPMRVKRARTLGYEVHFYPTDFKIVVYKTHEWIRNQPR